MTMPRSHWHVDNHESVMAEIAPYLGMSDAQKWQQMRAACQGAARQLALRVDRQRVLDWRDPLPQSTVDALARLRSEAKQLELHHQQSQKGVP